MLYICIVIYRKRPNSNNITFTTNYKLQDAAEYIGQIIDIISILEIQEDKVLRKRERDFLIACCLINCLGITYIYDEQALEIFNKQGFGTKKIIKTYLPKVVKKEWVVSTNDNISTASYLSDISLDKGICDFNIRLIYENSRSDITGVQ